MSDDREEQLMRAGPKTPPASGRRLLTSADLHTNLWASCGPAALAAILDRSLDDIRHAFPLQREGRTWTNLTQMREAIDRLGRRYSATGFARYAAHVKDFRERSWPSHGLVQVFYRGPWDAPGVPPGAAYRASHWIAHDREMVFDINILAEDINHGWIRRSIWEKNVGPKLAELFPRATGEWWVRAGIEVS